MEQKYNVTCSTDDNYVQHCVAMLCSLFENNNDKIFIVHLLVGELSDESRFILDRLCKKYGNELAIYNITDEQVRNLAINDMTIDGKPMYSIATYYRMLLPSLLDKNIDRVLYLDCDVIVLANVASLYLLNMENYGVAAVADASPYDSYHREKMGLSLAHDAFCAGVMMINLQFWRDYSAQDKLIDYANKSWKKIYMQDQDALNYVFRDCWYKLPFKWGKTPLSICPLNNNQKYFDYYEYLYEPSILHFASDLKPWLNVWTPDSHFYWEYLKKSECNLNHITKTSFKFRLKAYNRLFRYFINRYIRPFVPTFIEIILVDIYILGILCYSMLFNQKKFKQQILSAWLRKYK